VTVRRILGALVNHGARIQMLKDPTAHAILASGILIAVSIVAHGWLSRSPRYELVHLTESRTLRLDRETGAVVMCVPNDGCLPPVR
jgi:hypothetical protein